MASFVDLIQQHFQFAQAGSAWYGPSAEKALEGLSAEEAAAHPLPGAHSIWELVLHLSAWRTFTIRRLQSMDSYEVPLNSDADWPPVLTVSEAAWATAQSELRLRSDELQAALATFSDDRLEDEVFGKSYPYHLMILGLLQHDAYHIGQITQLKRAIKRTNSPA